MSVEIRRGPETIELGNRHIARTISTISRHLRTVGIQNRIEGIEIPVESEEFCIELARDENVPTRLTSKDFAITNQHDHDLSDGAKRLVFELSSPENSVVAEICYEIGRDDFFIRKHLMVRAIGDQPQGVVKRIDVERMKVSTDLSSEQPEIILHRGEHDPRIGQPIFTNELFAGLEYPAGHNVIENETIRLTHYPGRKVTPSGVKSKTSVLGVAERGKVAEYFRKYLLSIATPNIKDGPTSLIGFNSWLAHGGETNNEWERCYEVDEARVLGLIDTLTDKLDHEPILDFFAIDAGWQDVHGIWDIDKARFPQGFGPIVDRLKQAGMKLGLWVSLTGSMLDNSKSEIEGYELLGSGYCLAGPRYFHRIKDNLVRYVTDYDLPLLLFDFFETNCPSPDHGHLPGKPYSFEAMIDAEISLIEAVRRVKPDIFISDFTIRHHSHSPWWTMYIDALWMAGGDYPMSPEVPIPLAAQVNHLTAKDDSARWYIAQYSGNGVFTPEIYPPWATDVYSLWDKHRDEMELNLPTFRGYKSDAIILGMVKGTLYWSLYFDPITFNDEDWQFLARAIKWGRANKTILGGMKPILGTPGKREIYGYANFAQDKGVICIRNPFISEKEAAITLDERLGIHSKETQNYMVRVVYPYSATLDGLYRYGDTINPKVSGYETLLLEIVDASKIGVPVPMGTRYELLGASDGKLRYTLWNRRGSKIEVDVLDFENQVVLRDSTCEFPGEGGRIEVTRPRIEVGNKRIKGSVGITVPIPVKVRDSRAKDRKNKREWRIGRAPMYENPYLLILYESHNGNIDGITCDVRSHVDPTSWNYSTGWLLFTTSLQQPSIRKLTMDEPTWAFFISPLEQGRSKIEFDLYDKNGGDVDGLIGSWVWADEKLESCEVGFAFDGDTDGVQPMLMHTTQSIRTTIERVLALRNYT